MALTEIKPNFDVSHIEKWTRDFQSLFPLPEGWTVKIVSEKDSTSKINSENWSLGQTGMVGRVIKLADQNGVEPGKMRVIIVDRDQSSVKSSGDNFHEDLLG